MLEDREDMKEEEPRVTNLAIWLPIPTISISVVWFFIFVILD